MMSILFLAIWDSVIFLLKFVLVQCLEADGMTLGDRTGADFKLKNAITGTSYFFVPHFMTFFLLLLGFLLC